MLASINSLTSLRKLTLDLPGIRFFPHNPGIPQSMDLPILGQLEQFRFNTDDDFAGTLFLALQRYALHNESLSSLEFGNRTDVETMILERAEQRDERDQLLKAYGKITRLRLKFLGRRNPPDRKSVV